MDVPSIWWGDVSKFTTISPKKSGHVTYGDNNKGKIIGVGKIGMSSSTPIENVLLVEGLKHSLLSVSQLYDRGYKVSFDSEKCVIKHECHTLISSGDLCLMTCDLCLVLVRCLAPIIRQFVKFRYMPENKRKYWCTIRKVPWHTGNQMDASLHN